MKAPSGKRRHSRRLAAHVASGLLGLFACACATPAPDAPVAGGPSGSHARLAAPEAEVAPPSGPPADPAAAQGEDGRHELERRVTQTLEALAAAQHHLTNGELRVGFEQVAATRARLRSALALLPPEWIAVPRRAGGEPLRIARPRDPVRVSLSELDPAALAQLRPYRAPEARALRVDLDELERRLSRALAGPPERALAELYLASSTALTFDLGDSSQLAGFPVEIDRAPLSTQAPHPRSEL